MPGRKPLFVQILKQREEWGRPSTIVVTGENQIGKSCYGLSLCTIMDKSFDNRRVFFSMAQFLEIVKDIKKRVDIILDQNPHAKNYSFWVMGDEISRSCAARDWNTIMGKMFQMVTDAFGYLHINMVITELIFDVMKSTRKRINFMVEMFSPGNAKIYKHNPDRWGKRDWRERVQMLNLPFPPKNLWMEYMDRKRKVEFHKILEEAHGMIHGKVVEKGPTKTELIKKILAEKKEWLKLPQREIAVKVKDHYGWSSLSLQTVNAAIR